jgi:hypothetical protein
MFTVCGLKTMLPGRKKPRLALSVHLSQATELARSER